MFQILLVIISIQSQLESKDASNRDTKTNMCVGVSVITYPLYICPATLQVRHADWHTHAHEKHQQALLNTWEWSH